MSTEPDCCDQCNISREPTRFSFVWIQIFVSVMLIILMLQFMVSVYQKRKDILKYHDTISSFCACKHGWENRFLLMFTFTASANLLCMHFEEFNTRNWTTVTTNQQDRRLFIMFISEVICIMCLPLVGIFYTRGNDPNPERRNKDYKCPYGTCKIQTSEKVHIFGSYVFLIGLCITSIMWSSFYMDYFIQYHKQYYAMSIFFTVWSGLQLVMGAVFVIFQIILTKYYLVKDAFESPRVFRSVTNLDVYEDYLNSDERDEFTENNNENKIDYHEYDDQELQIELSVVGREQQMYRLIATRLRYFSFAVEGIVSASVLLMVTFSTLLRKYFIS
eukprot:352269_1